MTLNSCILGLVCMFLVRYKLYAEMLPASGDHCTVLVVSSTAEKRSSQLSGTLNPELLHGFSKAFAYM